MIWPVFKMSLFSPIIEDILYIPVFLSEKV